MTTPTFIQVHFLTSYSAVLLNRDDSGAAKRLPYGGAMRTRVSSQSQKRHWRMAEGANALSSIDGFEEAFRSREIITRLVRRPLEGQVAAEILDAIEPAFQKALYGEKADQGKASRQPLLIGAPEVRFIAGKFEEIAKGSADAREAKTAAEAFAKEFKQIMKLWRQENSRPAGLTAALFGRMVTSDTEANIDAPVHVAHAFTVHAEESESDYFSVVDDLATDEDTGADHIGDTELTSGLFYGYVVVDVPALVSNLTGLERADWLSADRAMTGEVVARLIHLIAETSPGAKLGSTAPYAYASTVLVEAGDRQPRSLAEAFRTPVPAEAAAAEASLQQHLKAFDDNYQTGEARRFMSMRNDAAFPNAERLSLPELSAWVRKVITEGAA